jgi:metal-sulfur cluster biosynthetic enzyme
MIDEERVRAALSTVRDPELDEPITELGFVDRVEVSEASVSVWLRLPTYFCAPNFAYLMVADAREAIEAIDGEKHVTVELNDHFASNEINNGLANGRDFDEMFASDTSGEGLAGLRDIFNRKAFISRQERLCRSLLAVGLDLDGLVQLRVGDLPPTPEARAYVERRLELGIDTEEAAPLLVTPTGEPITSESVEEHLKFARSVSVSIQGNASFCTGMLQTRYGRIRPQEARM